MKFASSGRVITTPAVLVLDVARGVRSMLVQQSGSLTDWVRTG